mmetsp:Transcript_8723/g.23549  ORF Transcript_8723/g.23549 Transcript_8723/m.23549 type:complete len:248 (-) Transcript_8723:162-905(-)|eukprot:CAMPEP_0198116364 /NCGR_PEP_ID=MMETSP1442-20131203/11894_1 /TAXON_ID= /ORGANISM="Craspedostauros australis, Strain CCMP3328" /LENGTH=247 /DNA_ID=CAMNT_0043774159 /DNA_START=278 /DNA_END=1021 /DNA_ORIENTATION=+
MIEYKLFFLLTITIAFSTTHSCAGWVNGGTSIRTSVDARANSGSSGIQIQRERCSLFGQIRSNTVAMRGKDDDMLEFIERIPQNSVGDEQAGVPPEQDELADMVRCIVEAGDLRKAEDIIAMRVSAISTLTSFIVILSGNSRPQNSAITAAIQNAMSETYDLLPGSTGVPEGSAESGWMVLDYGSIIAHVMTPKSRLFYNVEGKFRDEGGEYMDLSSVILPNAPEDVVGGAAAGTDFQQPEDDPFWS